MRIDSKLNHYRILAKIGEGGMGQVFRAVDETLKREVAIKVLPPTLAQNPERLARLEREAQVLAQVEHANIASIYGLEEATPEGGGDPVRLLVMQLAEGETLAARIDQGRIPVEEALAIALQIARALETAHEHGIVHRDLKPANVVLSASGDAKLLDFGLAKAFAADNMLSSSLQVSASPTVLEATQAGMIMGTAGYMSPEQARGKPVDRRADIWAFGAVLYEMLTGDRVFGGETATDVLGAIVHREPDWQALPQDTPRRIRALLQRCLRKDVDRRIQSIGDARVSIEEYLEDPVAAEAILDAGTEASAPTGWMRWAPWGAAALLGLMWVADLRPHAAVESAAATLRMEMTLGVDDPLFSTSPGSALALSPNGEYVAVATGTTGNTRLHARRLDDIAFNEIAGNGAYQPFFSPDSEWIGFQTSTSLLKIPTSGGTAQQIATTNLGRGASWAPDGTIVYAPSSTTALWRISANGGTPTQLTTLDETRQDATHRWPQILPDGKSVLFTAHTLAGSDFDAATIDIVDMETGARKTVHRGGSDARYLPSGHLVYASAGTLFAIPFDLDAQEVVGSAVPVVQNLGYSTTSGGSQYTVSDTGVLMYRTGSTLDPTYPGIWIDRRGEAEPVLTEHRTYAETRISPDGSKVAMMELTNDNWDIWVYDVARGVRTRLTFPDGIEGPAVWSPDGTEVIFSSDRNGPDDLYRKRADGSGEVERLTDERPALFVSDWSSDGRYVLTTRSGNVDEEGGWRAGTDLGYLDLEEDGGELHHYLVTDFAELEASFSPDGRWVVYQSNESGALEVYVRPFPPAGGKWQVSDNGGGYARWSPDGRELYYRNDEGMVVVDVITTEAAFSASRPRQLFRGNFYGGLGGLRLAGGGFADYDVAPDGRFLMFPNTQAEDAPNVELAQVVVNWFDELRRLAPPR